MGIPFGIRAMSMSSLKCRIGSTSRIPQRTHFPRTIVTTTSSVSTPQQIREDEDPVLAAQPLKQRQPSSRDRDRDRDRDPDPKVQRRKRRVPRLCPFNAYRATPQKLVKIYTQKLARGSPMIIRNLPGFLGGQAWIDHITDRDGSFKTTPASPTTHSEPGFNVLKALLASAVPGRTQGVLNSAVGGVFDSFTAKCKISQTALEGDYPPILKFYEWLQQSQFRVYSLDKTIVELQKTYIATPQPWVPFTAPLVFFRAIHQYNRETKGPANDVSWPEDGTIHDEMPPGCIHGLDGLVVLQKTMTEEFPFPRIIQDIGRSTYKTKSCSIRVGVRPLRSAMRRYKHSTVVIGQLAGYSVVTLIPPRVNLLDGLPLEFHKRVSQTWQRSTKRFPLGPSRFLLTGKTWSRDFEDELSASGDILLATLIPGDGLLVPDGWWYGVRSINNGLQLHATVTWFLSGDQIAVGDQDEYDQDRYLKRFPPLVEI